MCNRRNPIRTKKQFIQLCILYLNICVGFPYIVIIIARKTSFTSNREIQLIFNELGIHTPTLII
jgi:hypothetical protein